MSGSNGGPTSPPGRDSDLDAVVGVFRRPGSLLLPPTAPPPPRSPTRPASSIHHPASSPRHAEHANLDSDSSLDTPRWGKSTAVPQPLSRPDGAGQARPHRPATTSIRRRLINVESISSAKVSTTSTATAASTPWSGNSTATSATSPQRRHPHRARLRPTRPQHRRFGLDR